MGDDSVVIRSLIIIGEQSPGVNDTTKNHILKHELVHIGLWLLEYKNEFDPKNICDGDDVTKEIEFLCDFIPYYGLSFTDEDGEPISSLEAFEDDLQTMETMFEDDYYTFIKDMKEILEEELPEDDESYDEEDEDEDGVTIYEF